MKRPQRIRVIAIAVVLMTAGGGATALASASVTLVGCLNAHGLQIGWYNPNDTQANGSSKPTILPVNFNFAAAGVNNYDVVHGHLAVEGPKGPPPGSPLLLVSYLPKPSGKSAKGVVPDRTLRSRLERRADEIRGRSHRLRAQVQELIGLNAKAVEQQGETEAERDLYYQIGRYVVCFQALDNELMQTAWLAADPPNGPEGRRGLASLTFSELVTETATRVHDLLIRRNLNDTEFRRRWRMGFDETIERCREIGRERNAIVHSAYVHLEGGGRLMGIVRSDMRRDPEGPDVTFDQEWIDNTTFDAPLRRVVDTYLAVARCRMQLVQWPGRNSTPPG